MLRAGLFRINTDNISISIVPPPIPVPLTIPETKPVNIFNICFLLIYIIIGIKFLEM